MNALNTLREKVLHQTRFFPKAPEQEDIDISHDVILYVEGLSVTFDGFKALNDLNLYVKAGELRCLIGANGAGKLR